MLSWHSWCALRRSYARRLRNRMVIGLSMPRWVGVPMGRSRALLCLALLAESDSTGCGLSGATHREVSFPNCPLAIGIVDHQLPNETTVQPWFLTFFWQLSMVHGSNMRWVLTVAKSTFSTLPCHLQLLNLRTSGIDKSWPWPHLGAPYQIPKSLWWGTMTPVKTMIYLAAWPCLTRRNPSNWDPMTPLGPLRWKPPKIVKLPWADHLTTPSLEFLFCFGKCRGKSHINPMGVAWCSLLN